VGGKSKGLRPFRIGQIISAILLNAYVLAYVQHKIIYTGFLKSIPEPILNCYGGPLSVFACPMGSMQQIFGIHKFPWLPIGVFLLVGIVVGRMACGWVCPFGLWQDLLNKIPFRRSAGRKRWLALVLVAAITALVGVVLTLVLKAHWYRIFLYGWLPFNVIALVLAIRGKFGIPARLWLGGLLAAIGLALLVWLKLGASFGVVTGVVAAVLLGFTGRWFAAVFAAVAGFLVVVIGPATHLGPLAGLPLGIACAVVLAAIVLVLDQLVRKTLPATFLKYAFLLLVAVVVAYKTGEPWFCKLCPQGTLEAGIPLVLWDPQGGLRDLVGWLYYVKVSILLLVVLASMSIKRPFCRLICPIGALYSVFNKFSLVHLEVNRACKTCRRCAKVCPMDIEVHQNANQLECIRCLECKYGCEPKSVGVKY
jgi:Pyruvate/2-oxoacid:ferredoxin oxidoreductase delta subunit